MPHQDQQADGTPTPTGATNPGPSTNRDPVPDGIEGSLTRENVDQADGSSAVSPKSMKPKGGEGARIPDDVAPRSGDSAPAQPTQSKQFGDREEGGDRTVHNL